MMTEKPFCQFFCLVLTQNIYLSLFRSLAFLFVLVHTQLGRMMNYYITINTMKKHHSNCTSVPNCLIVLYNFLILTNKNI